MDKIYTAQEMREEARFHEVRHGKDYIVVQMLRQAAEALERELAAVSAKRDEWQKQALEENAALDVARAELEAKDEEIARLEQELFENKTQYGSLLIGRDALIKELAGALKWCHEQADAIGKATLIGCFQMDALTITMANMSRRCVKLIVKARAVVK